ncbi:MAG: DUF3783 domain-containing protein [Spirochaetota bacterium]
MSNAAQDERVILIHGFSREETIAIMRAAKSVSEDPQGIAFTTSTPSNLDWKLRDLIIEVREEHEYMRQNPPRPKQGPGPDDGAAEGGLDNGAE